MQLRAHGCQIQLAVFRSVGGAEAAANVNDFRCEAQDFRGTEGENLLLMENAARFVPAKEADGEDRVAVTVQFTATHRRWADSCKELQIDFGRDDEPAMGFNTGCKLFAKPPELIKLKMRSFAYSDPPR